MFADTHFHRSWFMISRWGRRTLYMGGMGALSLVLLLVGILNVSAGERGLWPSGGLCVLWLFIYSLTVGPLAVSIPTSLVHLRRHNADTSIQYSIISETSSVRLRPLTVVLSRVAYQIVNLISQYLNAYMVSTIEWNWSGKSGFFWGGTAFLVLVWSYFRLPEIKGRTYEELDMLFMQKVSARKFASTHVDPYEDVKDNDHMEVEAKS
jgi:MFS transporter, SP family, general alpha glucoside:H+ symporter